ncbi:WecB/TagA/CpsF family glycosyltransferase [Lentilactobacillus senioris]|uniref:N-acetylglucosaminyldiphosphoundecaprenol N-acetyl-beta-D-mannosaminyltransferase n=1 Tax=Lentilactobacillus senioris DSM 24302 = JCM 17472 TaxID=1423802 RepID=A0A0R2CPD7_9LACO|nr:WecB/TagA/CpsF family glycosyltransferase [Lentilactobacillus senioris]KRM93383.1 WecB TagA CpsF family glycosyl transferase [Lentilactobacillus senioris DSM 24302 = JCM 17472]
MNKRTVSILDIPFNDTTLSEFTSELHTKIDSHQNTFVVTANPEIVMYANQHPEYRRTILSADNIVADGIGIIIGSKMLNTPLPERVTGYDIFTELLAWGNANHKSAFFIGAKPEVSQKLKTTLKTNYPDLAVAGIHDGYFTDEQPLVDEITATQPDMVFVATGFPKQETFIQKHRHAANAVWIGLGGSFDVLTGTVKRAPKIWQNLHLEWLYRGLSDPKRIGRLMVLPKYLVKVTQIKIKRNRK